MNDLKKKNKDAPIYTRNINYLQQVEALDKNMTMEKEGVTLTWKTVNTEYIQGSVLGNL